MANKRGQNISLREPEFSEAALTPLGPMDRPRGEAAGAAAQTFGMFSQQVSRFADEIAVVEGTREGRIAGAEADFRPTNSATLKGRSYDRAGTDVYLSQLGARLQQDAQGVYERNRNNPDGFNREYQTLVAAYHREHVFPEAKGYFDAKAQTLGVSLRRAAMTQFETERRDQTRATLIGDLTATNEARARLLAANPESAESEQAILRMRDENIARVDAAIATGAISASAGEQQKITERESAWAEIITARAGRLQSPEQVQAAREQLKTDFAAGKFPGLTSIDRLDAALQRHGAGMVTRQNQALATLNTSVKGFLDRFGDGRTPSASEWFQIEQQGKDAGPAGQAIIANARAKLNARITINSLPLDKAEEYVRNLERQAKAGPGAASAPEARAFQRLTAAGLTPAQAAGVVGNLVQESRMNPGAINPGDGRDGSDSIGIAQWNGERAKALRDFAAARGKPVGDFDTQVDFIMHELNGRESAAGRKLRAATTVEEATAAFIGYERPKGWTSASPQSGHGWGNRLAAAQRLSRPGMVAADADVIRDARNALETRRNLVASDPLLAAEREGKISQIAPVDVKAAPEALTQMMQLRVAQAGAIAGAYNRPPAYFRADEKQGAKAILEAGGDKALDFIGAIVAGSGTAAPRVLKELEGDAPGLAHAGMVLQQTGDRTFARQVAEAQRARKAAPGARPPGPSAEDMNEALRTTLGMALGGMDAGERQRTMAAAQLWAEGEFARRNMDPKDARAGDILKEGILRARGMTGSGRDTYGGIAEIGIGSGWIGGLGRGAHKVQAPAGVRASQFTQVLDAITDADLAGLEKPPVNKDGKPVSARVLRSLAPVAGPGGYRFGRVDPVTGRIEPLADADGKPFVLDFETLRPALRQRVPGAFQ